MVPDSRKIDADEVTDAFTREVIDARRLLNYAVTKGVLTEDGRVIGDTVILAIKTAEDLAASGAPVAAGARAEFHRSYRDLAQLTAPVTARTLYATADSGEPGWSDSAWGRNIAIRWSRRLWLITAIFMAVAVLGETLEATFGKAAPPIDDEGVMLNWGWLLYFGYSLMETLVPFTYGGLGACAYLLRSAHVFIQRRCFDPQRIPEYYSRILIGVVGGGAIVLLIAQVPDESGAFVQLSARALGFIAGYNSDFLFNTIERIVAALLPKVSDATVMRAEPKPRVVSEEQALVEGLLDRLRTAKDEEEKKVIRAMLERIGSRG